MIEDRPYLHKIIEADLYDLIVTTCPIPLPDATKSLHLAMPGLLEAMLIEYEKRGQELLTYEPPAHLESLLTDDD